MYYTGSPEREPQLDAFSEARAQRTRTIANGIANLAQGIPMAEASQPQEVTPVIDMQQYFNGGYSTPDYYRESA